MPFVARYRKEATGGLDDTQLRQLDERLRYLRELDERRDSILRSIAEQGKLTGELEAALYAATDKTRLEDLYLPYKPKRRTRAQIAREAGLEPLAESLLARPEQEPEQAAAAFVDAGKGVADVKAALDGARAILIERFAEDAGLFRKEEQRFFVEFAWAQYLGEKLKWRPVTRDTLPTLLKASEIFACLPDAANLPGYPGKACD